MNKLIFAAVLSCATFVVAPSLCANTGNMTANIADVTPTEDTGDEDVDALDYMSPYDKMIREMGERQEKYRQPAKENGRDLGGYYCETLLPGQVYEWMYHLIDEDINALLGDLAFDENYVCVHASDFGSAMAVFKHYREMFEDLHREFLDDDCPIKDFSIDYSLMMTWADTARDWLTLETSTYTYAGGAHGYGATIPMTYHLGNGALVGYKDIFKEECYDRVLEILTARLDKYKDENQMPRVDAFFTSLEFEQVGGVPRNFENVNGYCYPRPAMTFDGVAYVYPTYSKGCFAEGDIKIVIPFDELKDYMK